MCGLAGFVNFELDLREESAIEYLKRMAKAIHHRGPDDSGCFFEPRHGIGLAHARLSILDLSPTGHQPMFSATGRYVVAFNGEIYNYLEIKSELNRESEIAWKSNTDTEVLLEAVSHWGLIPTLEKTVGMFAFALWDRHEKKLYLGRDRAGEKPLYYGRVGANFYFASELKAIRAAPGFSTDIDFDSVALYLRHNYIPGPNSIYKGIQKLNPGSVLTVNLDGSTESFAYWDPLTISAACRRNLFQGSEEEAEAELERVLKFAIQRQMVADVPVGAFLSGGVDSSAVVALMQSLTHKPVNTFTIGFNIREFDEAVFAKQVAAHLKTDHTEVYLSDQDALDVIPDLPKIYDEPFGDSSQIPTILVSKVAKTKVTVSLSGDAGDELFGGYNRYAVTAKLWGRISSLPLPARRALKTLLTSISPSTFNFLMRKIGPFLGSQYRYFNWGDKIHKGAHVLTSETDVELYFRLVSHWQNPENILVGQNKPESRLLNLANYLRDLGPIERMMVLDFMTYLPDDILTKVDRAGMSVSLESRIPFLDHKVIEFAWSLPLGLKIRNGQTKWLLRKVLYKYVPKNLIERPKMGFGIPLAEWLRGPLKEWAASLLNPQRLRSEGIFAEKPISNMWLEHQSGHRNWQYHLWEVLMFQAWHENQKRS